MKTQYLNVRCWNTHKNSNISYDGSRSTPDFHFIKPLIELKEAKYLIDSSLVVNPNSSRNGIGDTCLVIHPNYFAVRVSGLTNDPVIAGGQTPYGDRNSDIGDISKKDVFFIHTSQ